MITAYTVLECPTKDDTLELEIESHISIHELSMQKLQLEEESRNKTLDRRTVQLDKCIETIL
jgi:hypothetical protein